MARVRLDLVVPVLLSLTLVAFAAGSSSVEAVVRFGRGARWVALFVLLVAALAWAVQLRSVRRLRRSVIAAAAAFLAIALESTLWSVDPKLTFERGATFVVLLVTAAAVAAACAARPGNAVDGAPVTGGIAAVAIP